MHAPRTLSKNPLKTSIAALALEAGFEKIEGPCLELLTELMQCYMVELAVSTKSFAEVAGRTDPMVTDVISALVEIGSNIEGIITFAKRPNQIPLPRATHGNVPNESRILQVGQTEAFPPFVPSHLPSFPDPHTYIRTLTQKAPVSEYKVIREKIAGQKGDTELALTKFLAKTGDNENLFSDEPYAFPLIANKPKPKSYLDALLGKDNESQDDEWKTIGNDARERSSQDEATFRKPMEFSDSSGQIDNPYLRPINMPKLKTNSFKRNK